MFDVKESKYTDDGRVFEQVDTLYMKLYQRWKMYREKKELSCFQSGNVNEFCSIKDRKFRMYLTNARYNREMLWLKRRQQNDDVTMRSVFFAEEKQRRQCLEKEAAFNQITFEEICNDSFIDDDGLVFIEKMEMLENQRISQLIEGYLR
ncbi:hypothetical protein PMAC_003078 [Pneumocystis sp. 'macacae']|nr:hypothetical protein PMAC_003078 [Pneumocystis sp. 'macacae']